MLSKAETRVVRVKNTEEYNFVTRLGKTRPVYLGNLHERMKTVLVEAAACGVAREYPVLWSLIHDLKTEVFSYEPISPPLASRNSTR